LPACSKVLPEVLVNSRCIRSLGRWKLPRHCVARLLTLACALSIGSALAQPQVPLTLAEAQRLALRRSPQIDSQKAMAEASREMAVAAGELPDPQVFAGIENVPTSGMNAWSLREEMTMARIGLMQEFPRAEKRRLRSERALRDADRVDVAAEVDALTVRRETATAWLNAYFAMRIERTIASQIREAELQVTMANASFRSGRGSQNDVLAAQGALIDLRNRTVAIKMTRLFRF
jgi:outer membrane protein TolC